MRAIDVMTSEPVTVGPETAVGRVAALFAEHGISAVPVVDTEQRVLGIVSESDLLHRPETGTERRRAWWLDMVAPSRLRAAEFAKSRGRKAGEVMTRDVISVTEETPLADVAILLETYGVKRLPVVREGRLVGIVSRADLVRGLALAPMLPPDPGEDDRRIRAALAEKLQLHGWAGPEPARFWVKDRIVHLFDGDAPEAERQALRVAAEKVRGVRRVVEHAALAAERS